MCAIVLLLVIHGGRKIRNRSRRREDLHNHKLILDFVETGRTESLRMMKRGPALRDQIVRMGGLFKGEIRLKFMIAYSLLGFAKEDFEVMQGYSSERQMQALQRCRSLGIPIPEDGFEYLLSKSNRAFRWAVMEYLIHIRGRKAVPAVLEFLRDKKNQRKGIAVHLFSELAVRSPDSIPFLLEHTYTPILRESLLIVLQRYPVAGALDVISRNITGTDHPDLIVAGVKAMGKYLDGEMIDTLVQLVNSNHWPVRVALAHVLVSAGASIPEPTIRMLLEDTSYPVRKAAVKTLLRLHARGICDEVVHDVISDNRHPSYYLLSQYMQTSRRALAS